MRVSIVVPALDDAEGIVRSLTPLARWRARGLVEVLVADGGSADGTVIRARPWADAVFPAPRGRALQMNAGAARARGDVLLFLQPGSVLPPRALDGLRVALAAGHVWGRFDVRVDGAQRAPRLAAALLNLGSRLTGVAAVEQALFVTRHAFRAVGGFPERASGEDEALSRRLGRLGPPACLRQRVRLGGRRPAPPAWRWLLPLGQEGGDAPGLRGPPRR